MKAYLGLCLCAPLLFGLTDCSKNLMAMRERSLDSCKATVTENAFIPGAQPAKVLKRDRSSGPYCFTELGMKSHAQELACDSGFPFVSLVSIQRPGFWFGPCYRADLEFYSTAQGAQVSDTPIVRYDSIPATGFQVFLRLNAGGVLTGPQTASDLVNDQGDTATTGKTGFYVGVRYYPLSFLGFEAETGGLFGSADAPKTKSMSFTNAWSSNFGLSLIPWQRLTLMGRVQAVVSGGLNYTRLALADDYKKFVEQNSALVFNNDVASGFGWYSGGDLRIVNKHGFVMETGARYSQEYPKFPSGTRAFTGTNLLFDLDVGYQF